MTSFSFVLEIEGDLQANIDALALSCYDATFEWSEGAKATARFARVAASQQDAVQSAVQQVEAVAGLRVTRVTLDEEP